MDFEPVKQKVVIRTGDRIEFVKHLLQFGAEGAKIQQNTVPRLIAPFTAELEIMVDPKKPYTDTPHTRAYPPDHRIYTEQELESMTFEEFRESVALFGVKGRERKVMTQEYLAVIKKMKEQYSY